MNGEISTPRQVYLSGRMVPEEDAKISIFDSAVMLGDTVTESTRGDGRVGAVTKRLLSAWSELVGVDIVEQTLQQVD